MQVSNTETQNTLFNILPATCESGAVLLISYSPSDTCPFRKEAPVVLWEHPKIEKEPLMPWGTESEALDVWL